MNWDFLLLLWMLGLHWIDLLIWEERTRLSLIPRHQPCNSHLSFRNLDHDLLSSQELCSSGFPYFEWLLYTNHLLESLRFQNLLRERLFPMKEICSRASGLDEWFSSRESILMLNSTEWILWLLDQRRISQSFLHLALPLFFDSRLFGPLLVW